MWSSMDLMADELTRVEDGVTTEYNEYNGMRPEDIKAWLSERAITAWETGNRISARKYIEHLEAKIARQGELLAELGVSIPEKEDT